MQAQEIRTTSTNSQENLTTSQLIADDADWLEHITLDSSDCIQPSTNISFEIPHHPDPSDEDAALAAHLWDRQHASDLDEYEWKSDDLVSSASSVDENISHEEPPRLARKDEFEKGIRRDWTRTREYREQWEEDHVFYKQKIQARLEADDDGEYEEQSCGSEVAWSCQADQPDWGTPATSGGLGWSTASTEPWTAEESWNERKGEDVESWNPSLKSKRQNSDIVDEEGSVRSDGTSGKLCLLKHLPGQGPTGRRNRTYNSANSVSTLGSSSMSTRISTTTTSSSIYNNINTTNISNDDTAPFTPPHFSQKATKILQNPARTTRFRDPEPVTVELALNSTLNDGQALNSFLDTCIAKTQALLVNANEALNSVANIDEICESDYDILTTEKQQYSRSRDTATNRKPRELEVHTPQISVLKKSYDVTVTPKEIVRVNRWWKIKGGESWREIGGWADENLYMR